VRLERDFALLSGLSHFHRFCYNLAIRPNLDTNIFVTIQDIDMRFSLCHNVCKCLDDDVIKLNLPEPEVDQITPQNGT